MSAFKKEIELILAHRSDEAAQRIYEKSSNVAINLLKRYGWPERDCIEILGEAITKIIHKVQTDKIDSFNMSYILTTCNYIGANLSRSNRRNFPSNVSFEEVENEYSYSIDRELSPADVIALEAFNLLKPLCKEIIQLKKVDKKNHKEIVQLLDSIKDENHSRTTLKRCMKKLRLNIVELVKTQN